MKKYHLSILLIILCSYIFLATRSFALDEGGCLICHQYPGLVRLEKTGGFKVLHIDAEKYFKSPHGKFRCNSCHVAVVKVPHTGETKVDCTTKCHHGDDAKVLPENYPLKGFHKNEQSFIVTLQDESSCRVCHPLYPHSNNNLVRGFLNLHAGFMFCDVCHIKRSKFNNLAYDWENTENAKFSGEPFGAYYNPRTGRTQENEHFISRIAAFAIENGKKRTLVNTQDTGRANEFILTEKKLKPDEKEKELVFFHRDTDRKEISVACDECHSIHSILDFNKLGFDEKKTKDLIYINIKGLVTKYKIFYFPNLFGQ